ncbi:putative sodium-coupled neutral amino acid transporter 11 [Aplysia californica]|uniref:Putative sodium-coupled neutral amino acid transporter 11 n=1 Tax=Aplysia californica TaxID=6500 RepID=A0ABM0JD30_APLCA|nr:putative sodium-coupled neutral amino acid transporter 11 [Aplysia californica]
MEEKNQKKGQKTFLTCGIITGTNRMFMGKRAGLAAELIVKLANQPQCSWAWQGVRLYCQDVSSTVARLWYQFPAVRDVTFCPAKRVLTLISCLQKAIDGIHELGVYKYSILIEYRSVYLQADGGYSYFDPSRNAFYFKEKIVLQKAKIINEFLWTSFSLSDFSIMLLVEGGRLSNTDTYQDMVLVAFGRPGFYILTVLQFLYPFIAMVSYNVIIGDTITKIIVWIGGESPSLLHSVLGNRQFIITVVTALVTLPLSLYKNIAKLGKWAFLSIILILFIMVAVIIRLSTFIGKLSPTGDAWEFANYNLSQAVGIMAFAYMCHHNTFLIHSSMENPTQRRWGFVTHFSVLFSMVMCLVLGISGYASFTGNTEGDLMENYCRGDVLMNLARLSFAITIMLTYPVECFVTREVVENAVFPSNPEAPMWRHVTVTMCIVGLTAAVSMATDCLGIVLELNGVLAAAPLAYIFPAACVIRLRQEALFSRRNIAPILLLAFGVLVAVVGFVMAMINLVSGASCSHGREPSYCLSEPDNATLSTSTTHATSRALKGGSLVDTLF